MGNPSQSAIIRLLKILFIILNFLIPAVIILWGSSEFGPFPGIPVVKSILFFLLFFLVLPVSITYLIVSLNRVFPEKILPALAFFIPHTVNILIYWIQSGFSTEFLHLWMIQSMPLFLGYILALITGFILLLKTGAGAMFSGRLWENFPGFLFALFLIAVFTLSWLYMFYNGIHHLADSNGGISAFSAPALYGFSILMVFLFHFRLLRVLYREGKL